MAETHQDLSWEQFYRRLNPRDIDPKSSYRRSVSERDQPFRRFLAREIDRAKPVLDVGSNLFSSSYLPHDSVVAVNFAFSALSNNVKYPVCADGMELPFKNETFPVVLSRNVYGYIFNSDCLVSEMIRVLKSNGKFILMDMVGPTMQFNRWTPELPSRVTDFIPDEIIPKLPLKKIKETLVFSSSFRGFPLDVVAITGIK